MQGLVFFLAGCIIAVTIEDFPKYIKTFVWVLFVVIGIVLGALNQFRL